MNASSSVISPGYSGVRTGGSNFIMWGTRAILGGIRGASSLDFFDLAFLAAGATSSSGSSSGSSSSLSLAARLRFYIKKLVITIWCFSLMIHTCPAHAAPSFIFSLRAASSSSSASSKELGSGLQFEEPALCRRSWWWWPRWKSPAGNCVSCLLVLGELRVALPGGRISSSASSSSASSSSGNWCPCSRLCVLGSPTAPDQMNC